MRPLFPRFAVDDLRFGGDWVAALAVVAIAWAMIFFAFVSRLDEPLEDGGKIVQGLCNRFIEVRAWGGFRVRRSLH